MKRECEFCREERGWPEIFKSSKEYKAHIKDRHKKKQNPSTIEKNKMRGEVSVKLRDVVLRRDRKRCVECGSKVQLHVHHETHLSNGGTNELTNLKTLCYVCHLSKHQGESVYNLMIQNFWIYECVG